MKFFERFYGTNDFTEKSFCEKINNIDGKCKILWERTKIFFLTIEKENQTKWVVDKWQLNKMKTSRAFTYIALCHSIYS